MTTAVTTIAVITVIADTTNNIQTGSLTAAGFTTTTIEF